MQRGALHAGKLASHEKTVTAHCSKYDFVAVSMLEILSLG